MRWAWPRFVLAGMGVQLCGNVRIWLLSDDVNTRMCVSNRDARECGS
jgi:hypothetical protein